MKRIVLCEGKRDVKFVKCFYAHRSSDTDVATFLAEQVEYSRLKNRETSAIRNFLEPRNPYHVLAKSENGKPDLKRIFVKLVNHLLGRDVHLCLLIDLDGTSDVDDLFAELHRRVQDNYEGRNFGIQQADVIDTTEDQIAVCGQLTTQTSVRGEFDVLAFRTNLEDAAAIRDEDSEAAEETKLREFVTEDRGSAPTARVL